MLSSLFRVMMKSTSVLLALLLAISSVTMAAIKTGTNSFVSTSSYTSEYQAIPPFIESESGNPSVVLAFDISGSMLVPAYPESGVSWSSGTMDNFDPHKEYFGYFEHNALGSDGSILVDGSGTAIRQKYSYDTSNEFFYPDASGDWDGSFLNWLTMRRVDVAKKVMIGGKVVDRSGTSVNGTTKYILEGELENRSSDDYTKSYYDSSSYSPIPDGFPIEIANARISAAGIPGGSSANQIALADNIEVGFTSPHSVFNAREYGNIADWVEISFLNSYDTPPAVVAVSLTYDGQDATIVRVSEVTETGARINLQEWKSFPDSHGADDNLIFIVAEEGCHPLPLNDGTEKQFCAGKEEFTTQGGASDSKNVRFDKFFGTNYPAVYASLSTLNDTSKLKSRAFVERVITNQEFDVFVDSAEPGDASFTSPESVHWVAVESFTGTTALGAEVVMGTGTATNAVTTVNLGSRFTERPAVLPTVQTYNSSNLPFSVRIGQPGGSNGGSGWSEDSVQVSIQEWDRSSTASENFAYMAVGGPGSPRIRVALDEEPIGLVQENDNKVNFGLTVYDFDHRNNDFSSTVSGNHVNGGTMFPCYPIENDDERKAMRKAQALTDKYVIYHSNDGDGEQPAIAQHNGDTDRDHFCVPTSVHTPNDRIVQVIEDYPLIWGTTPIAESLIDVGRYFRQGYGHSSSQQTTAENLPYYENTQPGGGTTANRYSYNPYAAFGIDGHSSAEGFLWDPFYDEEIGGLAPCKSTFILNFNDGAPFRDFDSDRAPTSGHPTPGTHPVDMRAVNGSYGDREGVDEVAYAMRSYDCRQDLAGTQQIVSYFVYAALGAEEQETSSTERMRRASAMGGYSDLDGNNSTSHVSSFNTYSRGGSCTPNEWDSDGDCEPDNFYFATDATDIKDQLQQAIDDILARVASGGAASIISATTSGEGAIYQTQFVPNLSDGNGGSIVWYGELEAYMIDSNGLIRNDDGDRVLEDYASDKIIDSCFDTINNVVRVKLSSDLNSRPTAEQTDSCEQSVFDIDPLDNTLINPIWSAQDSLGSITSATDQRSYTSTSNQRYIFTSKPDSVGNLSTTPFSSGAFSLDEVGLLDSANVSDANDLINWVRGEEGITGYRNRTFSDGTIKRLGDIIYSTAVAVGAPSERIDQLYGDASYAEFARAYSDRRTVVYVGANDGMLHAFNAGWYDRANGEFLSGADSAIPSDKVDWELGQELWAYVPFNLLPHLRYLSQPEYGTDNGDHVYMVDQTPYIFDAQIFSSSLQGQGGSAWESVHPKGWGTVMIVGFRQGGSESEVYPDPSNLTDTVTTRPAYLIFDITDPEREPVLLAEFSHDKLNMTMATPTGLTVERADKSNTDWYLLMGSGPSPTPSGNEQLGSNENAHLLMLNLKTMSLETGFDNDGVLDLGSTNGANSFVGGLSAVDGDLDGTTDAIYFGTVQGEDTSGNDGVFESWSGSLWRLRLEAGNSSSQHDWSAEVMYDVDHPIVETPSISFDKNFNRWIHFGTGRYLTVDDSLDISDGFIVGLKEPRNASGLFLADTTAITSKLGPITSLVDTTDAVVDEGTGDLGGSVDTSPVTLVEDTVARLEEAQMRVNSEDTNNYLHGWIKQLGVSGQRGDRATGGSLVFGGFVFQSSFAPDIESCEVTGVATLHGLRFTTGTPWYNHIFGDPNPTTDTGDTVAGSYKTGKTSTLTPGIHVGENRSDGSATAIIEKADTSTETISLENLENIHSKEMSWREL